MTDRTRRRIVTVALAPAAALTAWAVVRLAGVDLALNASRGTVGPADVAVAAVVGALGAWCVVRLLERHTGRPGFWWPLVGSTALGVSMVGPSHLASGASAVALTGLHVVTAIVVIWGFATTLPARCDCGVVGACGGTPGGRAS